MYSFFSQQMAVLQPPNGAAVGWRDHALLRAIVCFFVPVVVVLLESPSYNFDLLGAHVTRTLFIGV